MARLEVTPTGTDSVTGKKANQNMHTRGKLAGALVYTDPFIQLRPETHQFLNDTFGSAMNQDVSFGGTPEIIHNGGSSTEWTASAVSGAWNFADSGKVSITSADQGDKAEFAEETPATVNMGNYTALTLKVDLDTYSSLNNTIILAFDLAGVPVGSAVNLNGHMDVGNFSEQSVSISKADFGLTTQLIDGFSITITRTGGAKPTIKFDDIQLEETGSPLEFKVAAARGTRLHVHEVRIGLADNIAGVVTVAGATENATMTGLSYNKFMSISALANGFTFSHTDHEGVVSSISVRQLGDLLTAGADLVSFPISDGTNTFIALVIKLEQPVILFNGDKLAFTINDNLSSLLQFTASAIGSLEVVT